MVVKYLNKENEFLWKIFLREALEKCGGCGDSALFMKIRMVDMSGVSDFYKEVVCAWGGVLPKVKYECREVKQVWKQPIFLNPSIKSEGGCIFNLPMWRAGFRVIRDLVYEFVPGFMRSQVVVDEVKGREMVMGAGTAERVMESIKEGMPSEWRRLIEGEIEGGGRSECEVTMHMGEGGKMCEVGKLKANAIYRSLAKGKVRRPAAEKVWVRVINGLEVEGIWGNLRVKGNSVECEDFDYLLRHNRIFNNLIISMFDEEVKRECDVCRTGVENCMHEFVECSELNGFFVRMKELIERCWRGGLVRKM